MGPSRPPRTRPAHDGQVPGRRSPTQATLREAAEALRGVLAAVDAGDLEVATPREVALLRRLQGVLVGWEEALGEDPPTDDVGSTEAVDPSRTRLHFLQLDGEGPSDLTAIPATLSRIAYWASERAPGEQVPREEATAPADFGFPGGERVDRLRRRPRVA
jgi:hypothetical protein